MGVDADIDITTEDCKTVLALLQRHLPGTTAWVYGSRLKWTSRPQSDLDLVVFATPEQRRQIGDLREAFEESNLPFRVDLFVWDDVPDSFRRRIEAEHVALAAARERHNDERWKKVPLGNLVEIYDGPHATPKKTPNGPVFLGISNLASGRLDLKQTERLSEVDYLRWTRRVTPTPNDIVFSYETRLGEAAIIPRGLRACLGRRMGLLRPRDGAVDARFLLYAFLGEGFQNTLRSRTVHGSTVDRIPLTEMAEFPIYVPQAITEQRAIAHILGTLDDKIELNRRMNATLEAMARALFKSWFVDFDPVRAKMEGRDTGLPKDIADLFPARLVRSELGEIPEGWTVGTLGEISEVIDCLHSKKPGRMAKGKPLLQLWNIRDNGLTDMSDTYLIDEADYERWTSRIEVREGDCVITNVGRVGAVSQIPPGLNAALGRNMTAVRCYAGFGYPTFVIAALLSDAMRLEIDLKTDSGTILNALNVRSIPKLRFVRAPEPVLEAHERIARPTRARMEANLEASRTLAALRDNLIPKLVSGELRVNEREPARGREGRPASSEAP